jgi:hypothetical protein
MMTTTYQQKLEAMAAECGLGWEQVQRMNIFVFAAMLDHVRKTTMAKTKKEKAG